MQRIISLHLKISMIGFFFSNLRDDNATANDDINDAVARLAGESGLDTLFASLEEPLGSRRTMMNNDKHMTCKQIDI